MRRISRDQLGLLLAYSWSLRGTCARKRVGCVVMTEDFHELSTGYNGPARGEAHCLEHPCPGVGAPSGASLDACEAIHAEANALLRCPDVTRVHTAYVTHSPCIHCVKLLMNTSCRRIVFIHPYAHDATARALWLRSLAPDPKRDGVICLDRAWCHEKVFQWSFRDEETGGRLP
jgi:dCMP deaminase